MFDRTKPLYAQLEQEIDGKRYAPNDEIDKAKHDYGTLAYLFQEGNISGSRTGGTIEVPSPDKPIEQQTRAELVATLTAIGIPDEVTDDQIRERIQQLLADRAETRTDQADEGKGGETTPEDQRIAAILADNAADVIAKVADLGADDNLARIREAEVAGKNRTTVVAALDKRIDETNAA